MDAERNSSPKSGKKENGADPSGGCSANHSRKEGGLNLSSYFQDKVNFLNL
jgi:hypothetical protein